MTNQELLEAFAPYLPYKVKCHGMGEWIEETEFDDEPTPKIFSIVGIVKDSNEEYYAQCEEDNGDITDVYISGDLFPILRPLSDLTKPCLEGGKVPIVELGNMLGFHNLERYEDNKVVEYGWTSGYYEEDSETYILAWSESMQTLGIWLEECNGEPIQQILNLKALNWLYAHHFWLGDQAEFGKTIININTLKQTNMNK